ncbi:MAG TPA: hypothetical protein PLB21_11875 [Actinomycetota bacterium]|nr:hypothetical protein [Actinomycetota bacterium]
MPFLEVEMVQVRETVRRWWAGESKMAIGRASGVSARTVPDEVVLAQLLRRNHAGPLPGQQGPAAARLSGLEERISRWPRDETPAQYLAHHFGITPHTGVSLTS